MERDDDPAAAGGDTGDRPAVRTFLPPIRAPRVLVVDDDPDLRAFVARAVTSTDDLEIEWADSLETARQLLESRPYVAVLTDYLFAESETGYALWRDVRKLQPEAAFAMMSSHDVTGGRTDLPFLKKPFTLTECRDFVTEIAKERQLGEATAAASPPAP